ncbi:hypothetical protein P168DRAFT_322128 [Aspergillus campestris IBT 28561]|uniref:Nephrocystin 3-like N-terminal domain-containing protein n=1 Tax=Aspergillus campestris (strain IBT 28561) TaxID=1392248 RepID=A0A2I1CSB0_ASPC2|nr:uncharacterized protein P168DRAFT_322128 [Aspergillus campestris IBT 28561]PKY00516.1 hypothetical protein P168DRAFT_322128 [Aspergillus campestris IBT 28561]
MKQTFPAIRVGLMVGIGGGVPGGTDIRLGDVVVGTRVMQADLGKITGDGRLEQTGVPRFPDQFLATAVSSLRAKHELEPSRVPSILQQKLDGPGYGRPSLPDRLFHATYDHPNPQNSCDIFIHYGAIASGSQVVKSSAFRDKVAGALKVLCFEMEAAGLMDILPCMPIRGICDYSDSHKSKEWQRYAAATAAACATELLQELPVTEVHTRVTSRSVSQQVPPQEQQQRMLDSLKFEQIDARRTNIKKAHAKTCRWFLSHQDYKAWLDKRQLIQHHGFLWVSGKPGAGKSIIMKFAYSNMKNKARNKNEVTASFFFNARGEYLEKSIAGMYRSLLLQLLEGYPDLQRFLDDPDLIPSPTQDASLSLNALKDLLCTAISALGQRPFTCFVDALDECDEQQVIDMIQYFEDLAEQSTARGVQFRICFSSRHYPYLSIRWGLRFTLEHQPGHTEDLEAYVESRLQIRDPMLIEKLRPIILRKAAGVFMWVVLVVDILNKEYQRGAVSMGKKLESLPSGLSDLFKDILQRDKESMEEFKLCVIWILCAKRPLQPREFYHALPSGLSFQDLDESEMPDASSREIVEDDLPRFHRYVISSSKGLAEVTNSTKQTVQFIHESVRDFLIKDKGLYELWPELGVDWKSPSHELLKQCCSFYMTHRAVRDSVSMLPEGNKSENQAVILDNYPFLGYAREFVFYHANAAAKVIPQDEFLSSFQIPNWIKINNLLEKYKSREYSPDASLYYILAERTSPELIRTRFKKDPNVHVVGERYRYPLFAALVNGEKSNFAALLNSPLSLQDGVDLTDGLKLTRDLQGRRFITLQRTGMRKLPAGFLK